MLNILAKSWASISLKIIHTGSNWSEFNRRSKHLNICKGESASSFGLSLLRHSHGACCMWYVLCWSQTGCILYGPPPPCCTACWEGSSGGRKVAAIQSLSPLQRPTWIAAAGRGSSLQRKGCKSPRGWKWFNFSTKVEEPTQKVPNWKGDEIWKPRKFQRCIFRPRRLPVAGSHWQDGSGESGESCRI